MNKTRIRHLERQADRRQLPGDRVTVVEIWGDRGAGPELIEVWELDHERKSDKELRTPSS